MGIRPHSTTKEKEKDTKNGPRQDSPFVTEDGSTSVGEAKADADGSLKIMVHDVDKGRSFLEEEQIIKTGVELSTNNLIEALIHISVLNNMSSLARNAVHSVALLLDQLKLAGTGEVIV